MEQLTHKINLTIKFKVRARFDLIQPRSNRGDHSLRTNNSHKPHSKWTSLGIRCTTKADPNTMQKDRSELHTVQSRAKCVRSMDFRRYRLSHFLCMSEPLSWSGSRSPAEKHFFALSMTPDDEPAQSISDQILLPRLRITNVPRADILSRRLCKKKTYAAQHSIIPTTRPPVVPPIKPPDQKTSQGVPGSVP